MLWFSFGELEITRFYTTFEFNTIFVLVKPYKKEQYLTIQCTVIRHNIDNIMQHDYLAHLNFSLIFGYISLIKLKI